MKSKLLKLLLMTLKGSFYGVVIQTIFFTAIQAGEIRAQRIESVRKVSLDVRLENSDLFEAFKAIEEKTSFKFAYDHEDLNKDVRIDFNKRKATVADLLLEISRSSNLKFRQVNDLINVNIRDRKHTKDVIEVIIQGRTITGKVISSEDDSGLPGVNVMVKGTSQGTVTDVEGNYSLEVPGEESVLVFSSVGYVEEEIIVGNQTVIEISMVPDITSLEEIVVVGYGTKDKKTIAGAVGTVDVSALEARPVTNALSALQGTAAGLTILQNTAQPGNEDYTVRIRGVSSIAGITNNRNSDDPAVVLGTVGPLVLVDGVQSSFSTLNPNDIESISFLKDGSASIYGNQAANGVILVTTKKGEKGKVRVNYDFNYGINSPTQKIVKMNTREFMESTNEARANDGDPIFWGQNFFDALGTDQVLNFAEWELGGGIRADSWLVFNNPENELAELVFENGIRQTHNLGFSGGGENSNYYLSLGYLDEDGVVNTKYDRYRRYNSRLNLSFDISKRLKLSTQTALEIGDRSRNTELNGALNNVERNIPFFPLRRPDGQYYRFRGFNNPLALLEGGSEEERSTNRLLSNLQLDWEIIDGLHFNANAGINNRDIRVRRPRAIIEVYNTYAPEYGGSGNG
ncbi:MAG: SusC/RagA family TonB-linked outer membrane protein, partial [Cytophagales bacterium]|nr:SusC/RagA family TonB-linked outer membrane protein [Cytophagales bacterium]